MDRANKALADALCSFARNARRSRHGRWAASAARRAIERSLRFTSRCLCSFARFARSERRGSAEVMPDLGEPQRGMAWSGGALWEIEIPQPVC